MRSSVQFFIVIAALAIGGYFYHAQVKTFAIQAISQIRPCSVPITYSVGSIDPRFDLATSSLVEDMRDATALWNTAAGKQLFIYVPEDGMLTVNLVYDKRQATTATLTKLGDALSTTAENYDAMKAQYGAVHQTYLAKKAQFESAYAAYRAEAADYEAQVRRWNARGGAPESAYAQLQTQKADLDQKQATVQNLQNEVNADADEVNALVQKLNALARTVNAEATQYNTVGRSTGTEFEEGVFESQPGHEEINVFEYDSAARLTRLLAHEFGHSLGLDHVDAEGAIMYRLNQGSTVVLTKDDRAELKTVCRLP